METRTPIHPFRFVSSFSLQSYTFFYNRQNNRIVTLQQQVEIEPKFEDDCVHLVSNKVLALVRPNLEEIDFAVETGKERDGKTMNIVDWVLNGH